ncbi:MAG: hypothetical protein P8Y71_29865 [Pseudolabrys sp.]
MWLKQPAAARPIIHHVLANDHARRIVDHAPVYDDDRPFAHDLDAAPDGAMPAPMAG